MKKNVSQSKARNSFRNELLLQRLEGRQLFDGVMAVPADAQVDLHQVAPVLTGQVQEITEADIANSVIETTGSQADLSASSGTASTTRTVSVSLDANGSHTFSIQDFKSGPFPNGTLTVREIPESGRLTLNGELVNPGANIQAADIEAGLLRYQAGEGSEATSLQFDITSRFGILRVSGTVTIERSGNDSIAQVNATSTGQLDTRREIAFVDMSVEGAEKLLDYLSSDVEVVILDSTRDGLEQIVETLRGRSGIDAIHILSHGNEGSLKLGAATLNAGTMRGQYADDLQRIGNSLSESGDILIWGCDFGRGAVGRDAVQLMADLTDADIAASTDLTGHASLNADWDLELKIGSIEARRIVTENGVQQWQGVMSNLITPFTSRFSTNDYGDIAMAANTLLWSGNAANQAGNSNNNSYAMVHYNTDSDLTTLNSSSAMLNLPSGSTVLFAGLYWMGNSANAARNTVKFDTPATAAYQNITGTILGSSGNDYAGFADVTSLVRTGGAGSYTIANVQANTGGGMYAGWALVVAYRDPAATAKNLTIFDGYAAVNTSAPATINIPISGFIAPASGLVNSKFGAVAGEGDRGTTGDFLQLNGVALSDGANPANNFFNSSITNSGVDVGTKNPNFINQTGFDADILAAPTGAIANGATSATLTMGTGGDFYYPAVFFSAIDIYAPDIVATKTGVDVNGGNLMPGDIIEYTIVIDNQGGDGATNFVLTDVIPNFTNYVAGSLQVVSGANAGLKTDAIGDDQAEYDSVLDRLTYRLGTGANGSSGGSLGIGEATTIRFRVQVEAATPGNTAIVNQANLSFRTFSTNLNLAAATSTSSMTVPANDPPVNSVPATQNVNEDSTLVFSAGNGNLISISDPDAGTLPLMVTLSVTNGALTLSGITGLSFSAGDGSGDSSMTFTGTLSDLNAALAGMSFNPTANFSGAALLTITTNDLGNSGLGGPLQDTDNVTINVVPVNDPPVAGNDTFSTNEDTAVSISIKSNDSDVEGHTLTVTHVNGTAITAGGAAVAVANGTVTLNAAGSLLIFTPTSNFNGATSFTYTISDGNGGTATATVSGTVVAVNDPPTAINDSFGTINEDASASVTVKSNDTDVDGNALSITHVNGAAIVAGGSAVSVSNGSVTLSADGNTLTFTPSANYNGPASYNYTINDGNGGTATATVSGSFSPVNDAPVNTLPVSFSTNEDTPLVLNGLSVSDIDAASGNMRVTLSVTNGTLAANTSVSGGVPSAGITGNGTGSVVLVGTLAQINATLANSTGVTFSPSSNFNGNVTLTMLTNDQGNTGSGGSLTDTDTRTIVVNAVNDAPVATNDSFTTSEDTSVTTTVLSNDSDIDGNTLTITQVNGISIVAGGAAISVTNGTVSLNAAGTQLTFTPSSNYNGPASYTYTVSDGNGGTATATVSGNVTAVNDPPVATNDSFTTNEDTSASIAVKANDTDVDGNTLTVTQVNGLAITAGGAAVSVSNGTVSLNAAGTLLTFTPTANFNGPTSFTYTVSDGNGGTATATVNGTVTAVNDVPVANNDTFSTNEDTAVSTSVLVNDTDLDGNPLSITHVNGTAIVAGGPAVPVTNGSVSLNAAGTHLSFVPAANYNGSASYTYTISDGNGGSATATVNGTIAAVNDPPVATGDSFSTNEDTAVSIAVKSNDSDVDGNPLTITQVNGLAIVAGGASVAVTNGTVSLNAAGTLLTFSPSSNYNGPVAFNYTISDGAGGTATATVNGTVLAVNDAPVATNDTFTVAEDSTATIFALTNDTDVDGNPLSITQINGSAIIAGGAAAAVTNGTVSLNAAGTQLTFAPSANYNGPVSFSYSISDGQGGSSTATISGTVTPVNDLPLAGNDTFSTVEDTAVSISVKANDSDVDGNTLTITAVNGLAIVAGGPAVVVTNGTVSLNAAGTHLIFNPTANYNGPASFNYTISDGAGGSATATVTGSVGGSNDAPVALADTISTEENSLASGNVLTNDSDLDGDTLTVSAVNGSPANVGTGVAGTNGGTFTILANGTYSFNPGTAFDDLAAGQSRTSTVTYEVSDGNGGTATTSVTVTVDGANDAPASTAITNQNGTDGQIVSLNVSGSFSDSDNGDSLAYSAINLPSGLSINASTGVISGTLSSNASQGGPYSVTITATDDLGSTTSQTFTWNVTNPAPAANNDTGATTENASASGNLISNDSDPDGDALSVSAVNGQTSNVGASVSGSNGGSFVVQSNGSYTFVPGTAFDDLAVGQTRTTSISYTISDGQGGFDTATVIMTITGTNDAPTSSTIATQNHTDGTAVSLNVSSSFSDFDAGTALAYSAINLPAGLSVNAATGVITGTISSSASASGPYTVTISATDPSGASTSQTFTWNVSNPAPTANHDSVTTAENSASSGHVLSNDSDSDGDTLNVTAVNGLPGGVNAPVTGTNGGQFTISNTGAYTFVPGTSFDDLAAGETRTTTVSYTISDGQGGTATATLSVTVTGVNDVPTSTTIAAQSSNDSAAVTLDVSGSFDDLDTSDTLTFSASNLPAGLSINPTTGVISGTLASNASVNGPYSVTITAIDSQGTSTTQTFTWSVSNLAPTATADSGNSSQTGSATGNVLSNDVDPDGDTLTVGAVNGSAANVGVGVAGTNGGTFSINTNGGYSFSPGAAFNDLASGQTRTTSVAYTATDSQGGTSTTILTITVTGTNDAPTSAPLATQASSDNQVVSINVSGNFGDTDNGDSLTYSSNNLPPGLSIDANTGLISGTIDNSASVGGPYAVTITATDPHGATTSQTFTWNISNPAPSAVADALSTSENATTTGNVLTNDSDPDGDTLLVSQVNGIVGNVGSNVTGSDGGTFTILANGSYAFNPGTSFDNLAVGETRTTSITYTISDSEGGSSSATLSITVTGTNDGPVSSAISNQIFLDGEVVNLDIANNFSDPDGSDTLIFGSTNLPPGLTLNPATGVISGTINPGASASGPYSVTVTATDSHGQVTSQTFNWVVTNVPPTAYDDFDGTTENSLVIGNVLTNDIDPDGDQLVVSHVNGQPGSVGASTAGSHGGFFTINSDGSYTFIPSTDFDNLAVGETRSTSIFYTANDNNGGAVQAMLTVVVTGVNDAPTSTPVPTQVSSDGAAISFDASASFSDTDSSDVLAFSASGLPAGLSINTSTGVINGTIASNASLGGPYSVTVTGTDPSGVSTSQTFTWNVINPGPTAVADTGAGNENAIVNGDVLANDSDADGDALSVNAVGGVAGNVGAAVTGSSGGTFVIQSNGNYSFNPGTAFDDLAIGETRTTSVSYTISDGQGGTSSATVTITVTGLNDTPQSTGIATQNGIDNSPVTLDVSGNFSDLDSTDNLTFSAGGTLPPGLSINPITGVISGTIAASASLSGPYSVIITATDPYGASVSQTFTWNLVNPTPTANADTATIATGVIGSGNVLTNDADPDGDSLTVNAVNGVAGNVGIAVAGSNGGSFAINSIGTYTFDAGGDFADLAQGETRTTSVSYTMTDGQGGFSTATVTITVVGGNEAPTSTPIATQYSVDNAPIVFNVSGNFSDADSSDVLTFSANNLPTGLSINPNTGVITGTIDRAASQGGPYTVTVTASDPWGAITSQTFTWNIANPAPIAANDNLSTGENTPSAANALTHGIGDVDPDGDTLQVVEVNGQTTNVGTAIAGSAGGVFVINATGAMTFNPGADFNDLAVGETRATSVTYTVSDGQGGTSSATVTYTVIGANDAPTSTLVANQFGNDGGAVVLDLSANFSDADGSDTLVFNANNSLPPGLSINPLTGVISGIIDPAASTTGPYTVTITATDPHGSQTTQIFIWNVSNLTPTATNDTATVGEGNSIGGNVISNDNDPDGDALVVSQVNGSSGLVGSSVTGSQGGTFFIAPNGTWTFNPGPAFEDLTQGESRSTTVTYTITDQQGGSDTAQITVTVTGTNDSPISSTISTQSGIDNAPVNFSIANSFSDPDGSDTLTFSAGGTLPPGLSLDPVSGVITGTIHYSASVGGPYSVTITATDPWGGQTSQSFVWNIANLAPLTQGESATVSESTIVSGNVLINDSDPDGDSLSVSAVGGVPANVGSGVSGTGGGLFTIHSNGNYTFNPDSDFEDLGPGQSRTTSISYTVSDADGATSIATIVITVTGNNDAPVVTNPIATQNGTGLEVVSLNVSSHFSDADITDVLTYSANNLPPGLSINPVTGLITGTISGTAASSGPYSVTVTATDPQGASVSTVFTWNVVNPDLVVSVSDSVSSAQPGETVVFTINYGNTNNRDATNIVLTQTLPVNTTFNAASSSPGWIDNGNGTFSLNLNTVAGLTSGSVLFAVTVDPTVQAGLNELTTQSIIADDGTHGQDLTPNNNTEGESTLLVAAPDVGVTVTPPSTLPSPGQTASYLIDYQNAGNQGATGVVVTMTLPPNTVFNPTTSTPGWVHQGNGVYTFDVGNLSAGDAGSLVWAFDLPSSMPAGVDTLAFTGSISDDASNGPDNTPSNNQFSLTTPVDAAPDYRIEVTDNRTQAFRGEQVTYAIRVVNQGNQDGTGVTVVSHFPSDVLLLSSVSHNGIVDPIGGTVIWHLGDLAGDGAEITLTIQATISMVADDSITNFSVLASVADDLQNGPDTTNDNQATETTTLRSFKFDSFHNRSKDQFGLQPMQFPALRTKLQPLSVDPIFSGLSDPGATLVGRIYDQHGSLIGERQVMADSSGNWIMTFPNSYVIENPYRMEIQQTASIQSGSDDSGFNLRRYFHPTAHSSIFFTSELTVDEVFRRSAYELVEDAHQSNSTPFGLSLSSTASHLATASTNTGQE